MASDSVGTFSFSSAVLKTLKKDVRDYIKEGTDFSQKHLEASDCKPLERWYEGCLQLCERLLRGADDPNKLDPVNAWKSQLTNTEIPDPDFQSDAKKNIETIQTILRQIKTWLDKQKNVVRPTQKKTRGAKK